MNNKYKRKIYLIICALMVFIFLFPLPILYATNPDEATEPYVTEDDGSDGPDTDDIKFELTGYVGENALGSGKTDADFTTNSKYGWREYEKNGEKYVVLAAATHEMLSANIGRTGTYWFYGAKFDHIHYFHYNDTIQFKFEDESFDSEVYNGIILDSGDAMMYPQHSLYKRDKGINMFDVYYGASNQNTSNISKISGKNVLVSTTGTFTEKAGTKSSTKVKKTKDDVINNFFKSLGDVNQIAIDSAGTNLTIKSASKLTYKQDDIKNIKDINKEIKVKSSSKNVINSKTVRDVDIPSYIENKQGNKETIFTDETEIPYIPIDFYSASINKIELLDINFFDNNSTNSSKVWNFLNTLVKGASRIVIYLSSVGILVMIIIRGILLVTSTFRDNPETARRSKSVIDSCVKSILIISLGYLLMSLIIYGYNEIIKIILNGNDSSYLIRVNVDGVYSFNTNLIGYIKYMSLNSNGLSSYIYTFAYWVISFIDLVWFGFMVVRPWIIAGLIVIMPISAVYEMLGRTPSQGQGWGNILIFERCISLYTTLIFVPLIMIGIYRILLLIA